MDHAPGVPRNDVAAPSVPDGIARLLRLGVCAGLVLSWLVMLLFAWNAFSTVPSAERLEETRMTQIPTLTSVGMLLLRSGVELALLLVLLWPARRLYLTRVAAAVLGLAVWFIATVPLTVTSLAWVHRRWLAALVVALFGVLVAGAAARLARHGRASPAQQVQHERNDAEL